MEFAREKVPTVQQGAAGLSRDQFRVLVEALYNPQQLQPGQQQPAAEQQEQLRAEASAAEGAAAAAGAGPAAGPEQQRQQAPGGLRADGRTQEAEAAGVVGAEGGGAGSAKRE